jgi:hypothetical protein
MPNTMERDFAATGSPRLPCGHNTGRQRSGFARFRNSSPAPSDVGYAQPVLCLRRRRDEPPRSVVTPIWQPRADFRRWWTRPLARLMPLCAAQATPGPSAEIAARTGLRIPPRALWHPRQQRHLPALACLQEPFTVASTGT